MTARVVDGSRFVVTMSWLTAVQYSGNTVGEQWQATVSEGQGAAFLLASKNALIAACGSPVV